MKSVLVWYITLIIIIIVGGTAIILANPAETAVTTVNVDGRDVTCITYGDTGISCNWNVMANDR